MAGSQQGGGATDLKDLEDNLLPVCFAAVIENRAKEVGVAVLDTEALRLELSQFVEAGHMYTSTLFHLTPRAPRQVVVVGSPHHEVTGSSSLNAALHMLNLAPLPRSAFDDTRGCAIVEDLAAPGNKPNTSGSLIKAHYLAFGAAGALLQHLTSSVGASIAPNSMRVEYGAAARQFMMLDRDTVAALELVRPLPRPSAIAGRGGGSRTAAMAGLAGGPGVAVGGGSTAGGGGRGARVAASAAARLSTLLGFLDHTSTSCGARLLRTNILQPLTDVPTLELRLDALQEMLESPHLALETATLLEQLPPRLEKMCSNLAITRQRVGAGAPAATRDPTLKVASLVDAVVLLRSMLRSLPALAESLAWVEGPLLRAVRSKLVYPQLQELLVDVEAALEEEAQTGKGVSTGRMHQVWAVRSQVDPFLDMARANFNRLTEAIQDLAEKHRGEPALRGLKAKYTNAKGWYFELPQTKAATGVASARPSLPRGFLILEQRARGQLLATTHELNALNARLRDAASDAIMLTQQVLDGLVSKALACMPLLLQAVDSVALLDVLLSFFHAVSGSPHEYVRPRVTPSGPLAVTTGRHPLLEALLHHRHGASAACVSLPGGRGSSYRLDASPGRLAGAEAGGEGGGGRAAAFGVPKAYAPNDTYVSEAATLHIITGPNMAGKSTYLKQVALLSVMAQIGCYVPASFMSITPFDRIFTRIGTADNIECNASSFMVEMAEAASIVSRATERSLVLMDELGRATSSDDGVGLAWAVCEYLLTLGCASFLATHFRQLEELAALYPSCRLWCMQVELAGDNLLYLWKMAPATIGNGSGSVGAQPLHYGIALARALGMPEEVLRHAAAVAELLDSEQRARIEGADDGGSGGGGGGAGAAADGGEGGMRVLRQVYSLVHRLGCVGRQAGFAADGGAGGCARQAAGASGGEEGADGIQSGQEAPGAGAGAGAAAAAAAACMEPEAVRAAVPLLRELKAEAERLCFRSSVST